MGRAGYTAARLERKKTKWKILYYLGITSKYEIKQKKSYWIKKNLESNINSFPN